MDNVPCYARSFIDPPFDFTKSNEDTLIQLRDAIKRKLAARGKTTETVEGAAETGSKATTLSEEEYVQRLDTLLSQPQS
jgi:hypothetical protein